jgi:hypothetical protein
MRLLSKQPDRAGGNHAGEVGIIVTRQASGAWNRRDHSGKTVPRTIELVNTDRLD